MHVPAVGSSTSGRCVSQRAHLTVAAPSRQAIAPRAVRRAAAVSTTAMWTRPTPDRDQDFIKPSYVPRPSTQPTIQPYRRDEQPLYSPSAPEFKPAELPDKQSEMPEGPKMPERRPDPIPAGNPKEKPPADPEKREAPPAKEK